MMFAVAALAVSTVLGFAVLWRVSVRAARRRRVEAQLARLRHPSSLPPSTDAGWGRLLDDVLGDET